MFSGHWKLGAVGAGPSDDVVGFPSPDSTALGLVVTVVVVVPIVMVADVVVVAWSKADNVTTTGDAVLVVVTISPPYG